MKCHRCNAISDDTYCEKCFMEVDYPHETIDEDTIYDMTDLLEALQELYDLLN